MSTYCRSHLSDSALQYDLVTVLRDERSATALVLADLAEFDARKRYVPAGYPSMFAYCVDGLRFSRDSACKRIHAARAAHRFPALFEEVAHGRLSLSSVVLLAPHLTTENAAELIGAVSGKHKSEIEVLVAERFPRSEVLPMVVAVPDSMHVHEQVAPGPLGRHAPKTARKQQVPASEIMPVAAQRFALHVMIDQSTHDMLREAQELLGHQVAAGDLGQVLHRALHVLLRRLRARKCGAADRPRTGKRHASSNPRYIPREVRRAVWKRDGGRCTFVGDDGHRCEERVGLELDHVVPVARGGEATVDGMRLRCRAHNQFEAERMFGAGFMEEKRAAALRMAEARRQEREARERTAQEQAKRKQASEEVIPYLRHLRFPIHEARRWAAACEAIPDAPLEERIRLALASYGRARFGTSSPGSAPCEMRHLTLRAHGPTVTGSRLRHTARERHSERSETVSRGR